MVTLALTGLVGGLVTGVSPCVLPVLPVVLFSSVEKGHSKARPCLVVAGLVVSFTLVTLFGSLLLSVLGLPQDVLRWAGLVVLALIGIGLIVPRFEHLLEKPFAWLPRRRPDAARSGFPLGLALGAVYVPCAGPVLAAITVAGSTGRIGTDTVELDNSLATWTNYRNRYWPAHYLVDASGTVRHIKFGEGDYDTTEKLIRELLAAADPSVTLPAPTDTADTTPDTADITPETYLGGTKQVNFAGSQPYRTGTFAPAGSRPPDSFDLSGQWTVATQYVTPAGPTARIGLSYRAKEVRMVLSGTGTVTCTCADTPIEVSGTPRSYRLLSTRDVRAGAVTVAVDTGVQAYSFTFG